MSTQYSRKVYTGNRNRHDLYRNKGKETSKNGDTKAFTFEDTQAFTVDISVTKTQQSLTRTRKTLSTVVSRSFIILIYHPRVMM